MKIQKVLTAILVMTLLLSCNRGHIVHTYKFDPTPLSAIKSPLNVDLQQLPEPKEIFAKDGINTSSQSPQPDGIVNWVEFNVPSKIPGRNITVNIHEFKDIDAAKQFMAFNMIHSWYEPKTDKFQKGILPNGLEYCATYIAQYRSDPEGCSRPMESYGSFLLLRSDKYLITVGVSENKPQGVTADDTGYVVQLLSHR